MQFPPSKRLKLTQPDIEADTVAFPSTSLLPLSSVNPCIAQAAPNKDPGTLVHGEVMTPALASSQDQDKDVLAVQEQEQQPREQHRDHWDEFGSRVIEIIRWTASEQVSEEVEELREQIDLVREEFQQHCDEGCAAAAEAIEAVKYEQSRRMTLEEKLKSLERKVEQLTEVLSKSAEVKIKAC